MTAVGIILRAELRAYLNRLLKRGPGRVVIIVIVLVIGANVVGGGAFAGGAAVGHFLPSAEDPILAGGFTALSVLMLVIGFPTVIATFFVGRDLLQLVIAPVRTIEVFLSRLVLAVTANLLISAVLLATVLGLGAGAGAPPAYYPLAAFLVAVQVIAVTSFQAVLMSAVLRFVPARVARDVAAGVAGLTGAALYLTWNVTLRRSFNRSSRPDLANLNALAQRIDWLPPAWPGHALSAAIDGNAAAVALWSMLAVGVAVAALVAAAVLYQRTLLAGLGVFGSTPPLWRRSRAARSIRAAVPQHGAGSPTLAIARKDWLAVRRDVRRLSRLLPAMLFPIGYSFALTQPARSGSGFWTNVFLITFMSMFMSTALATPSIPAERRGFLILRMAPLTMRQVLRAKVLLTLPPILIITAVFGLVVALVSGSSLPQVVGLFVFALWLGVGFVAIGVSAGGIDPHFDAVDDRRGVGLLGTVTSLVGSLIFALASVGAFALFVFGVEAAGGTATVLGLPPTPLTGGVMIVLGLVPAAVAVAVAGALVWFAAGRLESFEAAIAET